MRRRPLVWQILLPFLAILLGAIAIAMAVSVHVTRRFQFEQTGQTLETHALLGARALAEVLDAGDVQAECRELARLTGSRITAVDPSGRVLGDSNENPATMENHGGRTEVRFALKGQVSRERRFSRTLQSDWLYVAAPVIRDGQVVGVLRASRSLASVGEALRGVVRRHAVTTAVLMMLVSCAVLVVSRRVTRPLGRMVAGVRRFGRAGFLGRLEAPDSAELAELAEAMNVLADQLQERVEGMERQRAELDNVLLSMSEGIIAVDGRENVMRLNASAARLLNTTPGDARGRSIQEVVRNSKLQECVRRIVAGEQPFEEELALGGAQERLLRVSATRLQSAGGAAAGALLVLNDITALRALERMRSEFLANLSHEIRTPVTSIKGYAETLAADCMADPETVERFLKVIVRQSDRLCALVDDILALSNLERREVIGDVEMDEVEVAGLLDNAVHALGVKASEKQIRLDTSCASDLRVWGDAVLLEQAVTNLIDNAIKYSSPGGQVEVGAQQVDDIVEVHVADHGIGIASDHLPRLFERFYRVDKGRSRSVGGTGLGLAIVKHVAALHRGRVSVESIPGRGSRFSLHLHVRPDVF